MRISTFGLRQNKPKYWKFSKWGGSKKKFSHQKNFFAKIFLLANLTLKKKSWMMGRPLVQYISNFDVNAHFWPFSGVPKNHHFWICGFGGVWGVTKFHPKKLMNLKNIPAKFFPPTPKTREDIQTQKWPIFFSVHGKLLLRKKVCSLLSKSLCMNKKCKRDLHWETSIDLL